MKSSLIRDNIIETATHLFYKNGYNLTGINEVIKEAGIAKATLYSHFKSKEDLCIAYLQYKNAAFVKEIAAFTSKAPRGNDTLLSLFDFLSIFYNQNDFNGCWCVKTIAEIPQDNVKIRAEIQKQKLEFIDFINELVVENTALTSEDSQGLAHQIYLLYEGAVAESHIHKAAWPIAAARAICQRILE